MKKKLPSNPNIDYHYYVVFLTIPNHHHHPNPKHAYRCFLAPAHHPIRRRWLSYSTNLSNKTQSRTQTIKTHYLVTLEWNERGLLYNQIQYLPPLFADLAGAGLSSHPSLLLANFCVFATAFFATGTYL